VVGKNVGQQGVHVLGHWLKKNKEQDGGDMLLDWWLNRASLLLFSISSVFFFSRILPGSKEKREKGSEEV
jgi:hypothetical protein